MAIRSISTYTTNQIKSALAMEEQKAKLVSGVDSYNSYLTPTNKNSTIIASKHIE